MYGTRANMAKGKNLKKICVYKYRNMHLHLRTKQSKRDVFPAPDGPIMPHIIGFSGRMCSPSLPTLPLVLLPLLLTRAGVRDETVLPLTPRSTG
jgi:hypothetical protein